jgi:hypothetical protein
MAYIEFKNLETQQFFNILLNPKLPRSLPAKIAYQKWVNGKPVYTIITRD